MYIYVYTLYAYYVGILPWGEEGKEGDGGFSFSFLKNQKFDNRASLGTGKKTHIHIYAYTYTHEQAETKSYDNGNE